MMSSYHSATVRVGVLVERHNSKCKPFDYRMFFCRQRDNPKENNFVAEWAKEEVNLLSIRSLRLPGQKKMKVGEVRRYWVRMTMHWCCDYWGEWDSDVEIISAKRVK